MIYVTLEEYKDIESKALEEYGQGTTYGEGIPGIIYKGEIYVLKKGSPHMSNKPIITIIREYLLPAFEDQYRISKEEARSGFLEALQQLIEHEEELKQSL